MKKILFGMAVVANLAFLYGSWGYNAVNHSMGNQFQGGTDAVLLLAANFVALSAVCCILLQLLLIGRVRWIESLFGFDKLTRVHAANGFLIFGLILAHPVMAILAHAMRAGHSCAAQFLDFIKNWPDGLEAVLGLCVFSFVFVLTFPLIRKRLKYEVWYYGHLCLYVAVLLVVGHSFENGSDFVGHSFFKGYLYFLYAFVVMNLLYYRFVRPVLLFYRHRFTVDSVSRETDDVVSILIKGKDLSRFTLRAGQFMIFRFLAKGFYGEAHPFSLSCEPDKEQIRISCKRLGDFTAKLPSLPAGTPVFIDGPYGVFTSKYATKAKVLLIGGGIGITPLRSLAGEFCVEKRDTVLLYGNRTEKDIVFRKELDGLAAGGFLKVHHVLDDKHWPGETGRIDDEKIKRLVPDFLERDVYVCGPPVMLRGVLRVLAGLGVPRKQIHHELFSL